MHPSELALAQRRQPTPKPGSVEEANALLRIDELRDEERAKLRDTPEARRRRHARHWSRQRLHV